MKCVHADPPDPSKCHITGKDVDAAAVGEKKTIVLKAMSASNKPSKLSTTSTSCELVSEITGTKTRGSVEKKRQSNEYEISYQPTIKGRHQLHIKVEGQHIRGSPFSVSARSPVEKLGTAILTISGVN